MKLAKFSFRVLIAAVLIASCGKEYSSEILRPATGNWEFTKGGITYSGYLDSVYNTVGIGSNVMYISGKSNNGQQNFLIKLFGSSLSPGDYYSSQFQSVFSYSLPYKTIYFVNAYTGEFVVNLTEIDSSRIQGTFSGAAFDSTDHSVEITNGKFSTF